MEKNIFFKKIREIVSLEKEAEKTLTLEELKKLPIMARVNKGLSYKGAILIEKEIHEGCVTVIFQKNSSFKDPQIEFPFQIHDKIILDGNNHHSFSDNLKGEVFRIHEELIWIKFNSSFPKEIKDGKWNINLLASESTWSRIDDALSIIESEKDENIQSLTDILLKKKNLTQTKMPKPDFFNPELNKSQQDAVMNALQSNELSLIWGPPGTGKTTVLIEIILQAVNQNKKILVSTPSNRALDNILEKLIPKDISCVRIGVDEKSLDSVKHITLRELERNHPSMKEAKDLFAEVQRLVTWIKKKQSRSYIPNFEYKKIKLEINNLYKEAKNIRKNVARQIINDSQVIGSTHAGFPFHLLQNSSFDLLIMDEASQATHPISWVPICKTKKTIMAGDPKQLPPTYLNEKISDFSFEPTLFEFLINRYKNSSFLNIQYRMNEDIQSWPSKQFYQNKLLAHSNNKEKNIKDLKISDSTLTGNNPVVFIDTAGTDYNESFDHQFDSFYNQGECKLVKEIYFSLITNGSKDEQIGIISPYSSQVTELKKTIKENVEISTIDSFQGREKEIIIISLVRSNEYNETGFLKDSKRINVAYTRAKKQLIVIGDSITISSLNYLKNWTEWVEEKNYWKSAWEFISI